MNNVATFQDWILIGGQNGVLYLQGDNIERVYRQTFGKVDRFKRWVRCYRDRLFWVGDRVVYEVRENPNMPGFLEYVKNSATGEINYD